MRSGRAELLYGSQEICGGVDFVGKIFTEICIYIYIRICSIWYYVFEFHDLCYIVLLQNVVLLLLEP